MTPKDDLVFTDLDHVSEEFRFTCHVLDYGTIEYPELDGTHKDHRVHLDELSYQLRCWRSREKKWCLAAHSSKGKEYRKLDVVYKTLEQFGADTPKESRLPLHICV